MHKIQAKEFELDDFSHEHLSEFYNHIYERNLKMEVQLMKIAQYETKGLKVPSDFEMIIEESSMTLLRLTIEHLNYYREMFLKTKDKFWWWQMIQLLPSSYNQRRTVQLNYAVLKNMYHSRKNHKLNEWLEFCEWVETLPYAKELITGE